MSNAKGNLSDFVIAELEKMILALKPGDRLPTEKELAERFNVGRSTIRESMTVFVAQKMVVKRNEGTFVADNSKDYLINPLNLIINMEIGNIDDLKELREMLELSLVRLAAERATEEDILALEKADWLHREPGLSRKERRDRDIAFHRAIADATGNSVAGELLSALRTVIANRWEDSLPLTAARVSDSERNYHEEIIASLRRHDPDAAYGCLEAYFNEIHRLYALEVAAE